MQGLCEPNSIAINDSQCGYRMAQAQDVATPGPRVLAILRRTGPTQRVQPSTDLLLSTNAVARLLQERERVVRYSAHECVGKPSHALHMQETTRSSSHGRLIPVDPFWKYRRTARRWAIIDPGFISIMGATDRVSLRLSRRFDAKAKKPLRYRCNPTGQQRKFKRTRALTWSLDSDWLLFRLNMLIRCYR